uniref:Uncharacterized protein n=1 Tax=Aegilops tauschii subsp. strangulata TaxID=200361 RepID=A0A453E238_AEGTS
ATMALAPGSSGASVRWPPSYTPGARSPPSQYGHMLGAPFYLGFRVGDECYNPSFADYYYEDVEEYTPPSYAPGRPPSPPSQCGLMLGDPFPPSFGGRRECHNPSSADYNEECTTPSYTYTRGASSPPSHYGHMLMSAPPGHASLPDYTPSTPPPSPLVVSDTESCTSPYYTPTPSTSSRRAASPDYTSSTPPPSPLVSEAESSTSAPPHRHHPYQRSGASRINRGGRQRASGVDIL